MTIEVIPEDIRRAGRRMSDVADVVGDARPGEGLKTLSGALPGSKSASAAAGLIEAWAVRFKDWHTDALAHHGALLKCADYYEAEDRKAAREAEEFRRQIGLPAPAAPPIQQFPTLPGANDGHDR
ncbi:hypothetical protein ACFVJS_08365 [Nocardioides sp. NPDC057772]|uniref:hypothetical protein n=1 Tax=Nocardioides sp. NPDC057772 TaxID=3346245 RepID=UPI00366C9F12